ncbi:MAG: hypothetical protein R3B13_31725 [Polyangiaceae bacterium]
MALKYPTYADRFTFVELLAEGSSHSVQAEAVHLGPWIQAAETSYTTLIDPPGVGMRIVEQLAPRETTFVVELSTMKVLQRIYGLAGVYPALDAL